MALSRLGLAASRQWARWRWDETWRATSQDATPVMAATRRGSDDTARRDARRRDEAWGDAAGRNARSLRNEM
jgi:hypothetical protein